ncbi:GNAT family N-acetyltransferase [Hymenobacter metallilatus]|uniref:GNAT family N-acetyltransferase n=1 Tax=Hymenobacter metallilatus TaxID=2493666 RepID=A0A3R9M3A3_9BACT|nr:GNAT family N-acetyltransferase [Hymenobacter metallilatus]RSK35362.1 GNAT family N-acetyltransferase [Hymenobacter metallilatus]
MSLLIEYGVQSLPWDSQFFGFPVGRLKGKRFTEEQLREVIRLAREEGWRLVYWFVEPTDTVSAASAQALRIKLTDRKARFARPVPAIPPPVAPNVLPTDELTPRLLDLARQSGHHSRFRVDPVFQAGLYERLYEHWIRSSVTGQTARQVLVYHPVAQPDALGLITLGYQTTHAIIGLLAVQHEYRGQGIGKQLVEAALHYAHAWQLPEVQVTTQLDNKGACRFYEREGFERVHEEHVYHLWL